MGATVYYRQISKRDEHLDVWCPSAFLNRLAEAFGVLPLKLTAKDIPVLRGMAVVHGRPPVNFENPYSQVIEAIEQYGEIELHANY